MNHAAYLIQEERNNLFKVEDLKEEQINSLKEAMEQNMLMLQLEITKMNSERQEFNKAYIELKRELTLCQSSQE